MDIDIYPAADPDDPNRIVVITDRGVTATGYDSAGDLAEALGDLAQALWAVEAEVSKTPQEVADDRVAAAEADNWDGAPGSVEHKAYIRRMIEQGRKDRLEQCLADGTHNPVQHRDGKPPWCRACQLTARGFDPDELGVLGRTREETARLGIKGPRNEPGKHDVSKANTGAGPGVPPSKPRFNPQPR